jgi:type I restriction enzyme, S subunit
MGGEWRETTLGDVIELKRGYDLPQQDRRPGEVPLVSSSGVTDLHSTAMVTGPGVVTGRYGTLGQVFYIDEDFWPLNTTLYVRDFKGNDPRFISYFLRSLDFTAYSDKAAVPGLNRNHLHQAIVRVPADLMEQRAIAHILGTLDDKIELNWRMNETLEAMARALFKSWFVDFDPVRAKMEDRWRRGESLPGLPAHLYDMFPDGMVNSELGEIPEGWEVGTVGQHSINHDSRRVPVSGSDRAKRRGRYPYHGAAGVLDWVDDYLFDGTYLLVGEDGSVVGDSGLGVTQYVWGRLWVNNHAHVLQGKGAVSTEQLFLFFHYEPVAPYVTGAVQPKLSQGRMNMMPFVFPGDRICHEFQELVDPWFAGLRLCKEESRTLSALRDALLPVLISGELRVGDDESFCGREWA